jgi:hypothetical protein
MGVYTCPTLVDPGRAITGGTTLDNVRDEAFFSHDAGVLEQLI